MYQNPLTIDDLVSVYLRFKEWMDYDLEHSAYCAKEVMVFQELFGTSYVTAPRVLAGADFNEVASAMTLRLQLIDELLDAIYNPENDGSYQEVLSKMDRTTFRSKIHYFKTLHEAIHEAADNIELGNTNGPEQESIDSEPFEDHFDQSDALIEEVREFILSEHPELEFESIPLERAFELGLPRQAPEPIDHGPTELNA